MIKSCFRRIFNDRYHFGCMIFMDELRYVVIRKQSNVVELMDCGKLSLPLCTSNLHKKLYLRRRSQVVVGVANELSHLKLVTVANDLDSHYIEKYIQSNVFRFFKYAHNALYLDYRLILQNLRLLPIKKYQKTIQLLAAKKKDITQGLLALKQLKIKFPVLSVEGIALIRLVNYFLKPVPSFYLLLFFQIKKFSILVVERNYFIYKTDHAFISQDQFIQNEQVIQAITLVQSLYSFVNFLDCIILGKAEFLDYAAISGKTLHQVNVASSLKRHTPDENLFEYYAAIGLVL